MLSMLMMAAVALGIAWIMYYAVGAVAGSLKVGLGIIAVTFIVSTLLVTSEGLQVGLNIYPEDLTCTVLFMAAVARYLFNFKFLEWRRFLGLFTVLIFLITLGRGITETGLRDAGVQARGFYYMTATLFYVLSFEIGDKEWHDLITVFRWLTVGIMVIAVFRWGLVGAGLASAAQFEDPGAAAEGGLRVVSSFAALIVAESFLIESYYLKGRSQERWRKFVPFALLLSVILLQHRTLWVGIVPPIFWLGFKDKNFRRYAIAIVLMIFLGIMAVFTTNIAPTLRDALTTSATSEGTLIWRFSSWQGTFENWQESSQLSHLIGVPYGIANERVLLNGEVTDRASHGYFFDVLLKFGLIGLCVIVVMMGEAFRRSLSYALRRGGGENHGRLMVALLLLLFAYSITYGPDDFQMALLGVILVYRPGERPAPYFVSELSAESTA